MELSNGYRLDMSLKMVTNPFQCTFSNQCALIRLCSSKIREFFDSSFDESAHSNCRNKSNIDLANLAYFCHHQKKSTYSIDTHKKKKIERFEEKQFYVLSWV